MLNLYTTTAEIDAAVTAFAQSGKALQDEAHKLACSVLHHVAKYGDIHVVRRFLDAMPDVARTNSLRKWFETFGPVTFEGNKAVYLKNAKTRLGDAIAKPFWNFKMAEGDDYKPLDPNSAINALIKKFEKDAKLTGRDHRDTILALKHTPIWTEENAGRHFPAPLQVEYRVIN
jgi:hypothetical protein